MLALQRTAGNQAVQRLMRSAAIQAKLSITPPGDRFEKEADDAAAAVMRSPTPGVSPSPAVNPVAGAVAQREGFAKGGEVGEAAIQRQSFCPLREHPLSAHPGGPLRQHPGGSPLEIGNTLAVQANSAIQTKSIGTRPESVGDDVGGMVAAGVADTDSPLLPVVNAIQSPGLGAPLPTAVRARIEPVLGADLTAVRVHSDAAAGQAAQAIQARAFTHGSGIWLGRNESSHDVGLMAHEATHVVQQGAANLLMPAPPEGLSSEDAERLADVQDRIGGAARATVDLPGAAVSVAEARGAVVVPETETAALGEDDLMQALGARPAPCAVIEELCRRIHEVIRGKRPPDEKSLVKADPEAMARQAGAELDGAVAGDAARVQGEYHALKTPPLGPPPATPREMSQVDEAAQVPAVNARAATPSGVTDEDVTLGPDVARSRQRLDAAGLNSEPARLIKSGPIAEARMAQGELEQIAQRAPAEVLAGQTATLVRTSADMEALQAAALRALAGARRGSVVRSAIQQQEMVGAEAQTREKVSAEARQSFAEAQIRVGALLEPLPGTAMQKWGAGVAVLSTRFKQDLQRVEAWVQDRYSGLSGAVLEVVESVIGMPDWVVNEYDRAEQTFGDGVCSLVREISMEVNGVIAAAEAIIENSRARIGELFTNLPPDLQQWAVAQQAEFDGRLSGLSAQAGQARDDFNRDLSQRAAKAVQEIRTEVHGLRETAGGLVGRVFSAVDSFLENPSKFIIEGLLEILGISPAAFWAVVDRLGAAIDHIAEHPLQFANNLLAAMAQGFQQFFGGISDHLLDGLLDWLVGGLNAAGIKLPADFSLKSITTFFLELMGITWPRIRELLAKHIGEENVALLEQAYETVANLVELGPEGIFEMLKEHFDPKQILDTVLQTAIDYVKETLISAVLPRILGLFNPAGAIIQGVEAIYRVLKWVFDHAARIFTLVETVTKGVSDLIAGNIGGMATSIEQSLARLIGPVIDFLADFLGLGALPEKIAEVIRNLQQWVYGILDRVIGFLAEKGRAILGSLGLNKDSDDEINEDDPKKADKVRAGFAEIDAAEQEALDAGKLSHEEAALIAATVKKNHPVFTTLEIIDGGATWDYHWTASPGGTKTGEEKKEDSETLPFAPGQLVLVPTVGDAHAGIYDHVADVHGAPIAFFKLLTGPMAGGLQGLAVGRARTLVVPLDSRAKGSRSNPYAHLEDPPGVGPFKDFLPAQKRLIIKTNIQKNNGVLRSDAIDRKELVPATKRERGIPVNLNEVNIDHIFPRSKGGYNSYANAMVLSFPQNLAKSDIVNLS